MKNFHNNLKSFQINVILIKATGPLILKTVSDWPFTEKSSEAHFSTEKFGSSGVEAIKTFFLHHSLKISLSVRFW
jgi:hypothetical protein